ncbi:MAG: GTP-binding protein [Halobacteriales archaeon]
MTSTAGGSDRVPVTTVCGPLGAGKTTLVNRLLEAPGGRRLGLVVNDMGEVNVDAELLDDAENGVVDLSNGCICCRLGDDLRDQLSSLAERRDLDAIVVEASGISEPIPIAQTITGAGESGEVPPGVYLDTMVSVVDSYGFWKEFDDEESAPGGEPARPLADILVDAIEFCDVLLLNKSDMVPDDVRDRLNAIARRLQPRASIHRTEYSNVDVDTVIDTGRFDYDAARRRQGWKRALSGEEGHDHDGEGEHGHEEGAAAAHGITSFVYNRRDPFHPDRVNAWLDEWDGDIVRAKGFMYVASRPDEVIGMSQAGPSVQAGPIGEWGDDDPATRLVFIGTDLDEKRLRAELNDCVITDAERGRTWDGDPFPRES